MGIDTEGKSLIVFVYKVLNFLYSLMFGYDFYAF